MQANCCTYLPPIRLQQPRTKSTGRSSLRFVGLGSAQPLAGGAQEVGSNAWVMKLWSSSGSSDPRALHHMNCVVVQNDYDCSGGDRRQVGNCVLGSVPSIGGSSCACSEFLRLIYCSVFTLSLYRGSRWQQHNMYWKAAVKLSMRLFCQPNNK